jgi:hypothetical protein
LTGEEGDEEELGDSTSTPSRNVDKLLPPLPFIELSSRLIQEYIMAGRAG